jgi:2-polyprenyl-6-methoxyphenol hydroxylase-like FAD-dependent oxidoreductase
MDSTSTSSPRGESPSQPHILIVGAGITGLLLAQSLRKRQSSSPSLPTPQFSLFERDPTPSFRGAGWGLTIHWALDDFVKLLPQYLVDRLPETFVDPEAVERGETGNFLLYDLQTGEEKYRVPPNKRIRVSRERLRALLMDGLDVQVRLLAVDVLATSHRVWC